MNVASRQDYYLAQIAAEIRAANSSNPSNIKLEQFLLRFSRQEHNRAPETEEARKLRIAKSKAFWCGMVGAKIPK